jgi:hypothetical protein
MRASDLFIWNLVNHIFDKTTMMLPLLAALSMTAASTDKYDRLSDFRLTTVGRPPPGPPTPSCNKVAGCYGHGVCTPTLPGGTCKW